MGHSSSSSSGGGGAGAGGDDGCCSPRRCGKCYLLTLNSIMLLAGLAFIVLSIWLATVYKGYGEVITGTFIWAPLGCGLGICFMALLGFCGALKDNRPALIIYIIVCSLLLLVATVLGAFLLVEIGALGKAAKAEDSNTITRPAVQEVTTFESVLWNRCCADGYPLMPKVELCPCKDNSSGCLCYYDQIEYDFQNKHFDDEVCEVLKDVEVWYHNSYIPLVGSVLQGGCGSGDPKVFQNVVYTYAKSELSPGAWGILIVGLVLLSGVVLACCVCCRPRSKSAAGYKAPHDDLGLDKPIDVEDNEGVELRQHGDQVTYA